MNSPAAEAHTRSALPSLWTGKYQQGDFPPGSGCRRLPSLSISSVLPSPTSPGTVPAHTHVSFGHSPAVLHPRVDSVNELSRSLIHSLNQGMGRRLSTADSSPASSPLSGVFDRMAGGRVPSAYSTHASLQSSGVGSADVKSPVERRKSAVAEQPQPNSIFVTAIPLRRLSNEAIAVDKANSDRITIAAGVIPRARDRKRFGVKRSFDLGKIRKSISGPPRRLSTVVGSHQSSDLAGRRLSTVLRPPMPQRGIAETDDPIGPPDNTRQVYLAQARNCLPIIAHLMTSGCLEDEDRIELPMPHPEAWPSTLEYVAESQGELTEAVKQNVLYLGGRVE